MTALVGIDVGTSGVKAIALSPTGEILARAERDYPLSTPQPGWAEQDPHDWARAADAALDDLGVEPASIGWSGQMHGLVVLDEAGEVIRPAILWNDQRTAAECAEIEERIGLERLIQLTGNRALTGFTAPKLLWLRTHEPEAFARIAHVLLPKDYVRFRRTGEHAIDVADASGTLLFDVANRRWSDEVLAALELPREWLPPAYESTEIAGAGDQAAGALGVGIDAPRPALGRPRHLRRRLRRARRVPAGARGAAAHLLPRRPRHLARDGRDALCRRRRCSGSGTRSAGRPTTSCSPRRRPGRRAPRACSSSPTSRASGRRTPTPMRAARSSACSCATTAAHSSAPCWKASPTACATRSSCCAASASRPRSRRVSGGGARSELWLRIVASVLGLPLERTEAEEGAAYGAALLGAVEEGVFADAHEAVAATVRIRDRVEPDPGWQAAYEDGYARYRRLYPALEPRSSRRRAGSGARRRCSRSRRRSRSRARPCRPRCRAFAGS